VRRAALFSCAHRRRDGEETEEKKLPPPRSLLTRSARGASDGEEKKLLPRRALLTRAAGLPPLPIERVVERPPRTVRDLLPRGAPVERDGTWLIPDTWPHFLVGARGAALMTCDSDDLKSVSAERAAVACQTMHPRRAHQGLHLPPVRGRWERSAGG